MDHLLKVHSRANVGSNMNSEFGHGGNQQTESFRSMVEWLNERLPNLNLPEDASLETLRACLLDGTTLCQLLNKLSPGAVETGIGSQPHSATVEKFLAALDDMGLPGFELSNLQQGSMIKVLECLRELKNTFSCSSVMDTASNHTRKRWNMQDVKCVDGADRYQVNMCDSDFRTVLQSATKPGNLDPDVNVDKLMTLNSLDKAPTKFLFGLVDKLLDENSERKDGDATHHAASLLRRLVREIEGRVSNQADKILKNNNLCKVREGRYRSRVRALEALVVGAAEESEVLLKHLQRVKMENMKLEHEKKIDQQIVVRLTNERDERNVEIEALKQELESCKMSYERHYLQLESEAKEMKEKLEEKIKDLECLVGDSKKKVKEMEEKFEQKIQKLKNRELRYQSSVDSQSAALQGLRKNLDSLRRDALKSQQCFPLEFHQLGLKLKELVDAAENYHLVLAENRKLYNEVQDLKGNIRVYCRIRPFLPGQNKKQTSIEYIGENGELVVANPLKQEKDTRRLFKFNKVFAPVASQEEIFKDTQPLIRSVLDGYNVCIFAYGQTGSGKTYTMTGPDVASKKDWGVNYRALHDLFQISQSRRSSILYDIGVQMVEIYNEQVRDLLICDGSQKSLGIWSTSQPNGLAVPDASLHPVKSTSDVLELMNIGFMNRAVGATALNERSSRSHSILTVHVRGIDSKSNSVLRGCLHLVDLAGSERVDRSEARGDRLKEAQHINKSLSALGDVIFALAQKNPHVPYRNSKLTQVLQSSLGGQAKTLMFVQLNPDVESYSETISTLKFAERVSGVELGAARSNKEGKDLRELMEQVSSLKDTIAKKDEEIDRLRLVKGNNVKGEKRVLNTIKSGSFTPKRSLQSVRQARQLSGNPNKETSDQDNLSEYSDRHSEAPNGAQNINDDNDLLGFGDADTEERLSDISDSGLSMGTETDGSIGSVVEYTLFPDTAISTENLEKSNASSKVPRPVPRQPTGSSRLSLNKALSKAIPGTKKVAPTNSSSVKPKLRPLKR